MEPIRSKAIGFNNSQSRPNELRYKRAMFYYVHRVFTVLECSLEMCTSVINKLLKLNVCLLINTPKVHDHHINGKLRFD